MLRILVAIVRRVAWILRDVVFRKGRRAFVVRLISFYPLGRFVFWIMIGRGSMN